MEKARKKDDKPFCKDKFQYVGEKNHYICPKGHILKHISQSEKKDTESFELPGAAHALT